MEADPQQNSFSEINLKANKQEMSLHNNNTCNIHTHYIYIYIYIVYGVAFPAHAQGGRSTQKSGGSGYAVPGGSGLSGGAFPEYSEHGVSVRESSP